MSVQMTDEEKKKRIAELRAELKELQATPQSDWHKAFEAILRIETDRYKSVTIRTEVELGVDPPRTDYVILTGSDTEEFEESIFKIFRGINVIEYKNPHDSLNMRTIHKICGYAHMMIGVAEHEGDVPPEEVTLSIFRSTKNRELFKMLEEKKQLHETRWPGVYYVEGITSLPLQIVITSELKGPEYTALRTLTDKAKKQDVQDLMAVAKVPMDARLRMYYRAVLDLVSEKNTEIMDEILGSDRMEYKGIMRYFEEEINAAIANAKKEADDANARADSANKRADDANARADNANRRADDANARADRATKEADKAKIEADDAKKEADNAKKEADDAKKESARKDEECQNMKELMAKGIASIMSLNNCSLDKAMDYFSIPMDQKPFYENKIKQLR